MTTREKLKNVRRPVRPVDLPGGDQLHVRDLTLAELLELDRRAEESPEGGERGMRWTLLVCAYGLAEPDGTAAFGPRPTDADVDSIRDLTTDQIRAVIAAAVPTKADAKNG